MKLIHYFKNKKSAKVAKDRLQIIIAQQRSQNSTDRPDFLPLLRKEILELVAKYTKVDINQVKVDLQTKDNNSILELNVILPENAEGNVKQGANTNIG